MVCVQNNVGGFYEPPFKSLLIAGTAGVLKTGPRTRSPGNFQKFELLESLEMHLEFITQKNIQEIDVFNLNQSFFTKLFWGGASPALVGVFRIRAKK